MNRFGISRCCCGDCFSYEDLFDDASIGGNWSQESGSWSESGGDIATTDDYAQLIYTPTQDFTDKFSCVTNPPTIAGSGTSYKLRLIACWEDVNNYWFAECEYGYSTQYDETIRLGYVSGGSETILAEDTYSHSGAAINVMALCYRDGYIRALLLNFSGTVLAGVESAETLPGGEFGIGSGDLNSGVFLAEFQGWDLWVDTRSGYDANCGLCPALP